mgnify:CR=1 FL=1
MGAHLEGILGQVGQGSDHSELSVGVLVHFRVVGLDEIQIC